MLHNLLILDTYISSVIAAFIPHTLFFEYFFAFLSLKGYSIVIWAVIVIVLLIVEEKRDKKRNFIAFFLISFILTAALVTFPLKNTFQRQRPVPDKLYSSIACPTDYSFPSGHAATAFAAATMLAAYDKKRRNVYYLVAVLISLSRIYLHCHYLLDVAAGALVGTLISRVVLYVADKNVLKFR